MIPKVGSAKHFYRVSERNLVYGLLPDNLGLQIYIFRLLLLANHCWYGGGHTQ